jgi:spermidine/putrescine transport system permease protein
MGVSLLLFFVSLKWPLGLFTVFIAHTTFCISYVTMLVRARLQNFDYSLVEAAYDLGATSWDVFYKIMIPYLTPAIFAGALLCFTLSIDDFVITFFVVGPGVTTLPIYVYGMIKFGSPPLINALSTILIVLTFCIVWLTHHLSEKK